MAIPADVRPVVGNAALMAFATPKSVTSAWAPCERMFAWLDVAMDDAALVCECERVDDVMQNPHDLARAELSFSLEGGAK
jgi:hypothetical protein